jgi:hypothetical protein
VIVPNKKNEVVPNKKNNTIRKGVEFKLRKIEGLTNANIDEFMKKWNTSKNKTIFNQARKRGAGRLKGKAKTEERAKVKEENNFNTGKAVENLDLQAKKKNLTEKAKRLIKGVGGTIGKWKPAIEGAKNMQTLTNLELKLNQKAKLRNEIEGTNAKKFRIRQKATLVSSAMKLENDMKKTRNVFERRLRIDELKKHIEGLPIPKQNKDQYIKQSEVPTANLAMIRASANKQVNVNAATASKALVAGAIKKVEAEETKYNKFKPKLLEMAEKGGLSFMKKNIEAIKTAEDVKRVDNKIKEILKKRSERRGNKKNDEEAEAEATKLFNVSSGVKNLTRGKEERDVNKDILDRTRKLVGFGIGGKAREKFLARGRGMQNTRPLVKELDERLALINKVKNFPNRKELEKVIRNSNTTINKVRETVKSSQNKQNKERESAVKSLVGGAINKAIRKNVRPMVPITEPLNDEGAKAATKIQAAFRGKKNRNKVRKMKLEKGGVSELFVPNKNFKGEPFKVSENPLAMQPSAPKKFQGAVSKMKEQKVMNAVKTAAKIAENKKKLNQATGAEKVLLAKQQRAAMNRNKGKASSAVAGLLNKKAQKKQNRVNAKRLGVSVKKAQKIRQQKQRNVKADAAKEEEEKRRKAEAVKEEAKKRTAVQEEAAKRKAELLAKKKAQADAVRANKERIRKAGEAAEAKRRAKAELRKKNKQLAKATGQSVKATQKKQQIKRKSNPKKR